VVVVDSEGAVEPDVGATVVVVSGGAAEESVTNASLRDSSTTSSTKSLSGRNARNPTITTIVPIPTIGHFQRIKNFMSTPRSRSYGQTTGPYGHTFRIEGELRMCSQLGGCWAMYLHLDYWAYIGEVGHPGRFGHFG
jgi:hypothetical protein